MSEAARQIPEKEDSSSKPQTFTAKAYAAHSATSPLAPFTVARRSPRPQDVQIEILYCRVCASCLAGEEQFCENFMTLTYNGQDKILGGVTYGGYTDTIVVDEPYVLRVGNKLDPAGAAPLLCAGITTYSPMRHWKVGKGQKVGIVGLGGLGHMGVKFAHAFGAHVVLFTTSPGKTADALRLGADEVVISKNGAEME